MDDGSPGISWIIAIIMLFAIGVMFVIFNQVLTVHVRPVADNLITNSQYIGLEEKADLTEQNDKWMAYWEIVPFIFVFLIVIYLIISGFRQGDRI